MQKLAMKIKTDDVISGTRGTNPHRERNIGSLINNLWLHGLSYAPIKVNPVGGGGVWARGGDLTNFKIF